MTNGWVERGPLPERRGEREGHYCQQCEKDGDPVHDTMTIGGKSADGTSTTEWRPTGAVPRHHPFEAMRRRPGT
jgi:hypothetical protein